MPDARLSDDPMANPFNFFDRDFTPNPLRLFSLALCCATTRRKSTDGGGWLRLELVAQIEFLEWTGSDHLRHSKFAGLRGDKDAAAVRKEQPLLQVRNEKALNPSHEEEDDHNQ